MGVMEEVTGMNRQGWQRPVSDQEAYRRASGRRRRNFQRQIQAELRRQQVVKRLHEGQTYTAMAQALGVSRWTISRDVQALQAQHVWGRPSRR